MNIKNTSDKYVPFIFKTTMDILLEPCLSTGEKCPNSGAVDSRTTEYECSMNIEF